MNQQTEECKKLVVQIIQEKIRVNYSNFKVKKSKLQRLIEIENLQRRLDKKLTPDIRMHFEQESQLKEIYDEAVINMPNKPNSKSGYYPFKSPLTLNQIIGIL